MMKDFMEMNVGESLDARIAVGHDGNLKFATSSGQHSTAHVQDLGNGDQPPTTSL